MGEGPFANLAAFYGAFFMTVIVGVIGVFLAILFWIFIRDYPSQQENLKQKRKYSIVKQLQKLMDNSQNWLVALYGFTIWAPISIFASLWSVPFLVLVYDIPTAKAAWLVAWLWVGVGLGGPFLGWLTTWIKLRRPPLLLASSVGLCASIIIIYESNIPLWEMGILLFLFGFAGSAQGPLFAVIRDLNPPRLTGTAAGFTNMAVVIGGATLQPFVGYLLKFHWAGKVVAGVNIYTVGDYQFSLLIIPACFFLSFLTILLWLKETHCQPVAKVEASS